MNKRRVTKPVYVGGVKIGGGADVTVQSMTKTDTHREGMVHLIGFALLMGGIVLVSVNDIGRLIDGRSFLG